VYWWRKQLGPQPLWGQIDYEVTVPITNVILHNSAANLTTGCNPAHILWEVLTAPFPWGMAIDPGRLDSRAFETFGQVMEAENLGMNIYAPDGISAVDQVASMMLDAGFLLPQVAKMITPIA